MPTEGSDVGTPPLRLNPSATTILLVLTLPKPSYFEKATPQPNPTPCIAHKTYTYAQTSTVYPYSP